MLTTPQFWSTLAMLLFVVGALLFAWMTARAARTSAEQQNAVPELRNRLGRLEDEIAERQAGYAQLLGERVAQVEAAVADARDVAMKARRLASERRSRKKQQPEPQVDLGHRAGVLLKSNQFVPGQPAAGFDPAQGQLFDDVADSA